MMYLQALIFIQDLNLMSECQYFICVICYNLIYVNLEYKILIRI
jgi:hypothetical protein